MVKHFPSPRGLGFCPQYCPEKGKASSVGVTHTGKQLSLGPSREGPSGVLLDSKSPPLQRPPLKAVPVEPARRPCSLSRVHVCP